MGWVLLVEALAVYGDLSNILAHHGSVATVLFFLEKAPPKGEEVVVPFAVRLPWATPFTEMAGRALGVVLELRTRVDGTALRTGSDEALLHVSPLPMQEAVLDAFSGHGYTSEAGRLTRSGSRTSTSPTTSTSCSNCGAV